MNHKSNNNFVRVPANNLKTMKTNVSTKYAFPSSHTNRSQNSLKDLGKQRLKSRFDISNILTFDETRKNSEILEIDSDVRSKPLGQKRERGSPKKLPSC